MSESCEAKRKYKKDVFIDDKYYDTFSRYHDYRAQANF